MEPDDKILAWMGGFFDGEGSASASFTSYTADSTFRKSITTDIQVGNTEKDLLTPFMEIFGGKVFLRKPRTIRHKPFYCWRLTSKEYERFIYTILPHIKSKRKRDILLFIIELKTLLRRVDTMSLQRRESIVSEIHELNKRGNGEVVCQS